MLKIYELNFELIEQERNRSLLIRLGPHSDGDRLKRSHDPLTRSNTWLTCRQRLELMRHVYNEDSSPSTPEAKEDIFQCLTVYSNPKFSLANLLPSRLVLERAWLSSYRHVIRFFKCSRPRRIPLSLSQKSFLPPCRFVVFCSFLFW